MESVDPEDYERLKQSQEAVPLMLVEVASISLPADASVDQSLDAEVS